MRGHALVALAAVTISVGRRLFFGAAKPSEIKTDISADDIIELMQLKSWNMAMLAGAIEVKEAEVRAWVAGTAQPSGPARILMRQWLDKARSKAKKIGFDKP
jgi:hypothetical protein